MNRLENEIEINLMDLWEIFMQRLLPMILAAVLCAGAVYAYGRVLLKPQYKSTATLYLLKQANDRDYVYTTSDYTMALNVVNDCEYMVRSQEVLAQVIRDQGLGMSFTQLRNAVSVSNPSGTRVLEVTVTADTPTLAKQIVDAVCQVSYEKINAVLRMDQVNVYAQGTLANGPSNSFGLKHYAIAGFAGAAVVYGIAMVMFLLDDKIRTPFDVQKNLGLSVLGEIPNSDAKRKSGRYGRYGKYGYGRYGQYKYYGTAVGAQPSQEDAAGKKTQRTAQSKRAAKAEKAAAHDKDMAAYQTSSDKKGGRKA